MNVDYRNEGKIKEIKKIKEKINIFRKYLNECCDPEVLEIEEAIKNLEYEIKRLESNKN